MSRFREWLRPPRNLLILFVLIVCLPAAMLIVLGLRLLDQDRVLARQRQIDLLDRAADHAVGVLEQKLVEQRKRLETRPCLLADATDDSVCVVFRSDRIEAVPPQRLPYYPLTRPLKEAVSEPFKGIESYEFRQPPDLNRVLVEINRKLAASPDPAVRAGAVLRQGRILRKMERVNEALSAFNDLSRIPLVSINGEPADLVARRTRCAILEERGRLAELRQEAASLAADLRAGKWQLDRETFLHVSKKLNAWLGTPDNARTGIGEEPLASAVSWVYEKWTTKPQNETNSGVHLLNFNNGPVTILWSFGGEQGAAFIAGARYLELHWKAELEKAVHPARVYFAGVAGAPPADAAKVQRSAVDTKLPWTLMLTAGDGQQEPPEFAARRRNLAAGLAALLILITAGSYFVLRAVNRELAVARLQSDFVSAVSHEFRTPLTTLRQFNELLAAEDGPTPEKRHRFYQAQTRATERLHRLVESLLDFGRMEAGRRPYQLKWLDAAVLAHNVREEFLRESNGAGFTVEYSSDSGPHPVSADAEALSRALWNLLDNAVKYSGNRCAVELRLSRENGRVAIAVRDYGIGIPPSEQKRIFHKFVRGAASTSGGIRGTGLGLTMVRHIVEAHGGTVKLESAEGRGSTFTILLPAKG
jgi:signal transduction histidine kinase